MALSGGWIAAIVVIIIVVLVIAGLLLQSFGVFGGKKMNTSSIMGTLGGWDDDLPEMTDEDREQQRREQESYDNFYGPNSLRGAAATSAAEWNGGDGDGDGDYGDDGDQRPSVSATDGLVEGGGVFRLKVSDPEYTALLKGEKTVEARLDRAPFNRLMAGDPVVVVRARPKDDTSEYPGGRYKYSAEVVRIKKYASIEDLLTSEGHAKVYPGRTRAEGLMQFGMYLPPGTLATDPVMAIELREASGDAKPGAPAAPRARKAPKKKAE